MTKTERQEMVEQIIKIVKEGAYLSGIGIGFEDNCIKNEIEDYLDFEDNFKKWVNSDNVIKMFGYYHTQCSQYSIKMTKEELKQYFIKEYYSEIRKIIER